MLTISFSPLFCIYVLCFDSLSKMLHPSPPLPPPPCPPPYHHHSLLKYSGNIYFVSFPPLPPPPPPLPLPISPLPHPPPSAAPPTPPKSIS